MSIMKKLVLLAITITVFISCKNNDTTQQEPQKLADFTNESAENAVIYEANIRQYSPEGTFEAFTKEEVKEYQQQDPIEKVVNTLKKNNWIDDAGIEAMEEKIKAIVTESVQFAEESPYPEPDELYKDVYAEPNYPYIIE